MHDIKSIGLTITANWRAVMIKTASFSFWRETVDFQIASFDLERRLSVLLGKEEKTDQSCIFC